MVEKVQNDPTPDIFSSLLKELHNLTIKPGQQIQESDMCERFGSSRPPVRNAFKRLSDLGLLDIIPYKGVFASLLDLDYIHQMIHLRITIESKIIEEFITSTPNPFVIEELEHNIRKQQIMIGQDSISTTEYYSLDSEMHSIWFSDRRCWGIWDLIQQQEIHYTRFKILDFVATKNYQEITGDHIQLLEAIKNNAPGSVFGILARHLNGGLRRMGDKVVTEYGSYFKEPKDSTYWKEFYSQYFN